MPPPRHRMLAPAPHRRDDERGERVRVSADGLPGARRVVLVAITGAVCAALVVRLGASPVLPAYLCLGVVGVVLADVDVRTRRLPDALTLPCYPVGAALLTLAAALVDHGWTRLAWAAGGMAVLYATYLATAMLDPTGQGLGGGDVKLAGVVGLGLGWFGPAVLVAGAMAGFLAAAAAGAAAVATGRATLATPFPFAPFLLAGGLAGVLASGWLPGIS